MFKFKDIDGVTVYLNPSYIVAIEHSTQEAHQVHVITDANGMYIYSPTSEEDCRQFMFDLFKAMGKDYKYEG